MTSRLQCSAAARYLVVATCVAFAAAARADRSPQESLRIAKAQAAVARANGWSGTAYERLEQNVAAAMMMVEQDNRQKLTRGLAYVAGTKAGVPGNGGKPPAPGRQQASTPGGRAPSATGNGAPAEGPARQPLDSLDGADDAKDALRQVSDTLLQLAQRKQRGVATVAPRFHTIFEGNRGSGKTTMALELASLVGGGPERVDLTELARDKTRSESEPDARKAYLDGLAGKVVVVDNFELLGGGGGSQAAQAAKVWLADLAKEADKGAFTLVLTPTHEEADGVAKVRAMARLEPKRVKLPDLSDATLGKLLRRELTEGGYNADDATVAHVARTLGAGRGPGFTNAVTVTTALRQAVMRHATRLRDGKHEKVAADHLELADFKDKAPDARGPDSAFAKLDRMIGLGAIKEELRALDERMALNDELEAAGKAPIGKPSLNAVFVGNPGTGKTTVARLYGQFLSERGFLASGEVVEVKAKDLIGKVVGETEKNVRDAFARAKGRVLFIDEAYAFYDAQAGGYGKAALDTLVGLIDPDRPGEVAVVMAGYKTEMEEMIGKSNPGLARRMTHTFRFDDYTVPELGQILDRKLEERKVGVTPDGRVAALSALGRLRRAPGFGNAGTVATLVDQAVTRMAGRGRGNHGAGAGLVLTAEDIAPHPVASDAAVKALDELVGLKDVKRAFRDLAALVQQGRAREEQGLGNNLPNLNAVFTGNPGTGKTTVARLYGRFLKDQGLLSDGELIEVKPQQLLGDALGSTERNVKELLARARGKVLFIDEAYQLHERGAARGGFGEKAIDALVAGITAEGNEDIAVVMAGYKDEMNRMFVEANPGLHSRFATRFEFADYADSELRAILDSKLSADGHTMDAPTRAEALAELGRQRAMPHFGNARAVDTLLQAARRRQAGRLAVRPNATKEGLQKLTLADVRTDPPLQAGDVVHVLDDLVGQDHVVAKIGEYEAIIADATSRGDDPRDYFSPYFQFVGNPGVGKTVVARKMGTIFHKLGFLPSADVVEVDAADLIAGYEGQTANLVRETFERSLGKTLFIDEAYKLADKNSPFAKQAIERLLKLLSDNKGKVAVILAGYEGHMEALMDVNPGLPSRFSEVLRFADATPKMARAKIDQLAHGKAMRLSDDASAHLDAMLADLAAAPGYANYRDVETLFVRAMVRRAVRIARTHAPADVLETADFGAATEELLETKHAAHPRPSLTVPSRVAIANVGEGAGAPRKARTPPPLKKRSWLFDHAVEQATHEAEPEQAAPIAQRYTAEEHTALQALQAAVEATELGAADRAKLAKGQAPAAVVAAIAAARGLTKPQAQTLVEKALRATHRVEHELLAQRKVAPANTKAVHERVCLACGRSQCNFQPIQMTWAVSEDGTRTLIEQRRLPGTGW